MLLFLCKPNKNQIMKKSFTPLLVLTLILFITGSLAASPLIVPSFKKENNTSKAVVAPSLKKTVKNAKSKSEVKKEIKEFKKDVAKEKKSGGKSKIAAALLAFFLGGFGVHRFYMGQKKQGFMQLGGTLIGIALIVIGLLSAVDTESVSIPVLAIVGYLLVLGVSIWAFVDFIRILTGGLEPEEGFND